MKCDKCFFCAHIGKGIYADYPVKYCKVADQYFMPFVMENGEKRKLDFSDLNDLKTWHETGCNIHPKTVEKAKQEFLKSLDKVVLEGERRRNEHTSKHRPRDDHSSGFGVYRIGCAFCGDSG